MSNNEKKETPSSTCEIPLQISPAQEKILHTRFQIANYHYNQCLTEAKRRLNLVRQSKKYQDYKKIPRTENSLRKKAYQAQKKEFQFEEYALHKFETKLRNAYFTTHLDSHVGQALASRAYLAINRIPYSQRQNFVTRSSAEKRIKRTKTWDVVVPDFQSDGESPRQLLLFPS